MGETVLLALSGPGDAPDHPERRPTQSRAPSKASGPGSTGEMGSDSSAQPKAARQGQGPWGVSELLEPGRGKEGV